MFEEIRLAALIHKGVSGDPTAVPAEEALKMGTIYGAKSVYLPNTGRLAEGMKADFIAMNTDQAHFIPHTDFISHMVYSAGPKDVEHVWVNGNQVVKHGSCLTIDEERVRREAQACFEGLLSR
ncbi:S-triazine hydrolase [compost metagenome]